MSSGRVIAGPSMDTPRARNIALGTAASSLTHTQIRTGTTPVLALTNGFGRAFEIGAGFAVAGAILTALPIATRDSRRFAEETRAGETQPAAG